MISTLIVIVTCSPLGCQPAAIVQTSAQCDAIRELLEHPKDGSVPVTVQCMKVKQYDKEAFLK